MMRVAETQGLHAEHLILRGQHHQRYRDGTRRRRASPNRLTSLNGVCDEGFDPADRGLERCRGQGQHPCRLRRLHLAESRHTESLLGVGLVHRTSVTFKRPRDLARGDALVRGACRGLPHDWVSDDELDGLQSLCVGRGRLGCVSSGRCCEHHPTSCDSGTWCEACSWVTSRRLPCGCLASPAVDRDHTEQFDLGCMLLTVRCGVGCGRLGPMDPNRCSHRRERTYLEDDAHSRFRPELLLCVQSRFSAS